METVYSITRKKIGTVCLILILFIFLYCVRLFSSNILLIYFQIYPQNSDYSCNFSFFFSPNFDCFLYYFLGTFFISTFFSVFLPHTTDVIILLLSGQTEFHRSRRVHPDVRHEGSSGEPQGEISKDKTVYNNSCLCLPAATRLVYHDQNQRNDIKSCLI